MSRDLRNSIVEHLKKKGNYEPSVDDYLIDVIMDNLDYIIELKTNINLNGLIVKIPNGNGIKTTKENPAFGTYEKCLHNILTCSMKLGINRNDRLKLKLLEESIEEEKFNRL